MSTTYKGTCSSDRLCRPGLYIKHTHCLCFLSAIWNTLAAAFFKYCFSSNCAREPKVTSEPFSVFSVCYVAITLRSYFHCALLPAPSFCAACFESLIQHKLLYLESEYMGTCIICKFHLKMPLEQERGREFRSSHGQTIHWYYSSREIFSSVLYSLQLNKAIHTTKIKYCVASVFPTCFTAMLSKCLHLSFHCIVQIFFCSRELFALCTEKQQCAQITQAWSLDKKFTF